MRSDTAFLRKLLGPLALVAGVLAATPAWADPLAEGRAYLETGQYRLALAAFEAAERDAPTDAEQARAALERGQALFHLNRDEPARLALERAVTLAGSDSGIQARTAATLALLAAGRGEWEESRRLFDQALNRAGGDELLRAGIELGQASVLPEAERAAVLKATAERLRALPPGPERASYLTNLAVQARKLGGSGTELAYTALKEAQTTAGLAPRFQAEITGELAQLYEEAQRWDEALRLNGEALRLTPADADDLRLELHWRQARLLRARQKIPEAVEAFQRAADHVAAIRADIPLDYHDGRSSFRDLLEPLYLQYADLLLTQTGGRADLDRTPLLRRARQVVEFIKQSEFEDFLGGRCAVHPVADTAVDSIAPETAVLYPIILPDRLELLVSHGGTIRQFTRPVSGEQVRKTVRAFAGALRFAQPNAQSLAQTLYGWLVAPADAWLREQKAQTLVVVPDGVLRLIPLAALHDGQHYLIERYALGTSPGLTLIAPSASPLQAHRAEVLLAGMDEPGEVIDRLPAGFLNNLDGGGARGLGLPAAGRSRALTYRKERGVTESATSTPMDLTRRASLRETLRLPGVAAELRSLQTTVPGTLLLGADFTSARFKRELLGAPYSIVHVASHGILGASAADSFILAYDDVISLDQLEGILKADKFARQPVELLTLSACQTAEGDDRAPLGFSGIALKTEVRSALGTLWPVNDEAASKLMVAFYRAFTQPGVGRAAALQQAQQALLKEPKLSHPYFWAPFILVGNWL